MNNIIAPWKNHGKALGDMARVQRDSWEKHRRWATKDIIGKLESELHDFIGGNPC
jgi:hypothetical protein